MKIVVEVQGYSRQMNAIAFIKLIRQTTGESLAPAKERVDALLEGTPFELGFDTVEAAESFARAAGEVGAVVRRKTP